MSQYIDNFKGKEEVPKEIPKDIGLHGIYFSRDLISGLYGPESRFSKHYIAKPSGGRCYPFCDKQPRFKKRVDPVDPEEEKKIMDSSLKLQQNPTWS